MANIVAFSLGMVGGCFLPLLILSKLPEEWSELKRNIISWGVGVPLGALVALGITILLFGIN